MIHPNSIEAARKIDDKLSRQARIIEVYRSAGRPLTDRQVKEALGLSEMNQVRPRITELVQAGRLREVGKYKDEYTRTSVRLVALAARVQRRMFG